MLKIIESQNKLTTVSNHDFNKSVGGRCNEVKSHVLSLFDNEGLQEAYPDSQVKKINK